MTTFARGGVMAVVLSAVLAAAASAQPAAAAPGPIHQLRIYEIFERNKAAFHERFRDHAVRIMEQRYGFRIVTMWEAKSDTRTEFVYVLEWPDEMVMRAQWAKFLADKEWSDIKDRTRLDHGALVGDIQERVLYTTPYARRLPPAGR